MESRIHRKVYVRFGRGLTRCPGETWEVRCLPYDNGLQYIIFDGAKHEHVWQTNIYAWIARQNGYRIDRIEIAYLSLMQVVKTGQIVSLTEFLVSPPARSGKRKHMLGFPRLIREYPSGKKKWECFYRIPEVPLYDDEMVVAFATPRLACLSQAFQHNIMPPVGEDEIRKWKCDGYCRVREVCEAEEQKNGRTLVIPQ